MRFAGWKMALGSSVLAALLAVPTWGSEAANTRTAMPGTLNYVEGQASIGDQTLNSQAVGNASLDNGQVLQTGNGKAEILLTPGVYLRVGNNSTVRMVSNSLTNTEVDVSQGEAMVEVDQLYHENNLQHQPAGSGHETGENRVVRLQRCERRCAGIRW